MKTSLREFLSGFSGSTLLIVTVSLFCLWVILGGDKLVDFIFWVLN